MSKIKAKVKISVQIQNEDKMLEQHIENFKQWLQEEGIDPESNLGSELIKQTRLLMELGQKLRGRENKNCEIAEKEEWLKSIGAINIEEFKYMVPFGDNQLFSEEYIKNTLIENMKADHFAISRNVRRQV